MWIKLNSFHVHIFSLYSLICKTVLLIIKCPLANGTGERVDLKIGDYVYVHEEVDDEVTEQSVA